MTPVDPTSIVDVLSAPFLDPVEHLREEELRVWQVKRLRALAREVFPSNPFVAAKWKAAGVGSSDDLVSLDDLKRLPFTTKRELLDDQAATPPFGTNLTYPLDRYVRVHQTSGTTGVPLRWLDTAESWAWMGRCWSYVIRAAGIEPRDRVFFPFSFGPSIGFWGAFEGACQLQSLVIAGGGQDSVTRLAFIKDLGATAMLCTPSYALHLLEVGQQRGLALAELPVRIMIHAGEPGAGIPEVRRRIEAGWGAKAFDHAGSTEAGTFSFECVEQCGLHVNEAEFIAEVIDPLTGAPSDEGELVLTSLGRAGSPVFRYRSGDRVRVVRERCGCGRSFMRLEGGVLGRTDDMLIVRGVNVFPSAIEGVLRRFPAIGEFQIVVTTRAEMQELELVLEIADDAAAPLPEVIEAFRKALGIRVAARPVPVGSLPRFELKSKRVIRKG